MCRMNGVEPRITMKRPSEESKENKRTKQGERIYKSLVVGIGIFVFISVVIKLFLGHDTWKYYAIVDAVTGGINSYIFYQDTNKMHTAFSWKPIKIGIEIFFVTAFILGILISLGTWLSVSFHVSITIILTGYFAKWEN